jgi:hypothetical protein
MWAVLPIILLVMVLCILLMLNSNTDTRGMICGTLILGPLGIIVSIGLLSAVSFPIAWVIAGVWISSASTKGRRLKKIVREVSWW